MGVEVLRRVNSSFFAKAVSAVLFITIFLSGCSIKGESSVEATNPEMAVSIETENVEGEDNIAEDTEELVPEDESKNILVFRDVFGEEYETEIKGDVSPVKYDKDGFVHDGYKLSYKDAKTILGVDVSHHQGYIDWQQVKNDGYDFAIIRIGYRGYGKAGTVNKDRTFEDNYKNAKAAGLKVGVYFFAQAINEDEAEEEADFVLGVLNGRGLDLPVVYDPENILDDEARTDNVSGEQFTANTKVFCQKIKDNGYDPMIYSNMLWEAFELDLSQLSDYPIWYADYEEVPQTPYDFEMWQYTNEGKVSGISGVTDLNIWMTGDVDEGGSTN